MTTSRPSGESFTESIETPLKNSSSVSLGFSPAFNETTATCIANRRAKLTTSLLISISCLHGEEVAIYLGNWTNAIRSCVGANVFARERHPEQASFAQRRTWTSRLISRPTSPQPSQQPLNVVRTIE